LVATNQITPTIAASTTNPISALKPSGIGDETLISAHCPYRPWPSARADFPTWWGG
jgi:hypothetical protein